VIFDFRVSILEGRRAVSLIVAFACLFVAPFAHAEAPAQSKIENRKSKISTPYLWKITRADGSGAPSWLFGTIHLQRPDVAALAPAVRDAVDKADAVYTELPMDTETLLGLTPKLMIPGGKTLGDLLGAQLTADLTAELKSINPSLTLEPLEHLKPWAVAASLIELDDQLKYPGVLPLDIVLFQRAAMAGKEVGGLETPDEQLAIFEDLTAAEQVALLRDTITQLRAVRATGRTPSDILSELYLTGDLDKLVEEIMKWDAASSDPKFTERLMERLLYRRNDLMAGRIEKKLREHPEKSFLFAVGAAHLQGPRGLLAALEKAGYRLTRAH
jgi:uncharacterized protein YbaP (TraB family)